MKIAVIFGTRPEIIKLSPVIRALGKACSTNKSTAAKKSLAHSLDFFIIHTNQHYDKNMDAVFLKELKLPKAKYNLNIGSGTHGNMTGRMLIEVEKIFFKEKPDLLIVQGDTNTVLAVSLAATKLHIPIAHVEAGLRSYSKIPEETNRVLTDRISDFCFAPTEKQKKILLKEGIPKKNIYVVGNTVVDAVIQNIEFSNKLFSKKKNKNLLLKKFDLKPKKYFLVTAHREENVDKRNVMETILKAISHIQKYHNLGAIFPMHPRTRQRIQDFKIKIPGKIKVTEPLGYLEMLSLMENSLFILTDSGCMQEEACTLGIPCLTMRESTERPESIEVGANILVGTNLNKILASVPETLKKLDSKGKLIKPWKNPFGYGKTGEKIVEILKK